MKCDELKPYLVGYERQYYVYDATGVEEAIAELKQKLEDAKASHYAEMVDAGMRERRLRRALWLARAEIAKDNAIRYGIYGPAIKSLLWSGVDAKCLAKAEEYK